MAIDEAMCYAVSREHFIELMELEGYKVNWSDTRKYITYTCPNGMKCRDNKLHEEKYLNSQLITQHLYTIGKKDYVVNSVFDLGSKHTVIDGVKRLIDNDFDSAA